MNTFKKYWDKFALTFILILAGFLSIFNIWNEGYGNEFYAASVKSMLVNWKNFFFASLDPGGWVTVDKPPVSLWVQTASAKIFGFYGWSIILPECLAAVATTAIIYHIVKCHFGKIAGLISALVLAISPIFIVISKTNNTDSVLILLMVLATWALMVAADKGQLRYLLLSVVFLGIAYNAKTLEAFLILPALFAVYFFATNIKWRTRIWHLLVATVVLAIVSLSWSVIVDLTPASERPYVDNSTTNSELELAIGYNGLERITGQNNGGSGKGANNANFMKEIEGYFENGSINMPSQSGEAPTTSTTNTSTSSNSTSTSNNGTKPQPNGENESGAPNLGDFGERGNFTGGTAGGGMFSGGGSASIFRMFNSTLGGQDSWLLPFGLFAILGLILRMRKSAGADKETRKKLLRNVILWGGTVIIMVGYFSISGFFHPYYISVMAPFLAALVGIGLVEMWKMYKEEKGVFGFILPIALAVTAAVQIVMLRYYPSYDTVMIPIVAVITGIPAVILIVLKLTAKDTSQKIRLIIAVISFAGLLVAPAVWTVSSEMISLNAQIPTAGPSTSDVGIRIKMRIQMRIIKEA
jgi:4-amino-4-deoxy-L-arabinose transferase-like glycosyltransferase